MCQSSGIRSVSRFIACASFHASIPQATAITRTIPAAIRQSLERRLQVLKTQSTHLGNLTEEDLDELDIEDGVEDALEAISLDMEE